MKLLLDTHAVIWWVLDKAQLSRPAERAIGDPTNVILVSAASAFELALKHRLGKLAQVEPMLQAFDKMMIDQRFEPLSITVEHGRVAGGLSIPHKDPFDRMLIAQAQVEGAWLVSNEELFDQFGVRRLW